MTATAALRSGLVEAWRRPRLVAGLFVLNVLWAVAAVWPFYAQLTTATARSPYAGVLARGLDFDVLAEVLQRHPAVVTAAFSGVLVGLVAWMVLSWFLTAGVLGALRAPAPEAGLRSFVDAALGRGLAMARLQLLSLLPYGAALVVTVAFGAVAGWLGSRAASPWTAVWAALGGAVPGLVLWLWATTAVDLARARAFVEEEPRMRRLLWSSLRQVPRWPCRCIAVQLLGGVLWIAVSLLYLALGARSPFAFAGGLLLLTVLREALVVARIEIRLGVLGGTLALAAADDS
ncbi:MAG: hypothetical protein HY906_18255 [Deltaproteobacteria bacterium]|nr:hypothetical protein [Deltaproteobacteria bacterium]